MISMKSIDAENTNETSELTKKVNKIKCTYLNNEFQKMNAQYNNTLLNATFLPFLNDKQCLNETAESSPLCVIYFDMVYNLLNSSAKGLETQAEINHTIVQYSEYDDNFCRYLHGNVSLAIELKPFSMNCLNIVDWLAKKNSCAAGCFHETLAILKINPMCSLILGGCQSILKQHPITKANTKTNITIKTNETIDTNNKQISNLNNDLALVAPKELEIPSKSLPTKLNPSNNNDALNAASKKITTTSTVSLDALINDDVKQEDDELTGDTKMNYNDQMHNANDEQGDKNSAINDDDSDGQAKFETQDRNTYYRENLQTNSFRTDQDSTFFPYFMSLLFVVVLLYVGYHNKSKILALLIEGRRSRTYSSRGNRRKQHLAEYRKLDSNLEEAIQSDAHVLSTQIIY